LTERDRRILRTVSKNHKTTVAEVTRQQNWRFIFKTPHPQKRELHKSNIHGRAAIARSLISESNAQMRKRWCHEP
jgi:hypothetical protein